MRRDNGDSSNGQTSSLNGLNINAEVLSAQNKSMLTNLRVQPSHNSFNDGLAPDQLIASDAELTAQDVARSILSYEDSTQTGASHPHLSRLRSTKERIVLPSLPVIDLICEDLTQEQLRDFAFTCFAVAAQGTEEFDHWRIVGKQLGLEGSHANNIVHLITSLPPGTLNNECTLQIPLVLLQHARLSSFPNLTHFLRWRDNTTAFLQHCLMQLVTATDPTAWKDSFTRLRGALRRLDVRSEMEYSGGEYGDAATYLSQTVDRITTQTGISLALPHSVRACTCQLLLSALFDTTHEGHQIEHVEVLLPFLQHMMWPLLGISAVVHAATFAWEHFRWYVATSVQSLARRLKALLNELRTVMQAIGSDWTPEHEWERTLAREVSSHIILWSKEQLADYYAKFSGDELHIMQGILDINAFAAYSRGDDADVIASMMVTVVTTAVAMEFDRRLAARQAAHPPTTSGYEEIRLLDATAVVRELMQSESDVYSNITGTYLAYSKAVAFLKLHSLYAKFLLPWVDEVPKLGQLQLRTIHAALALEPALVEPVQRAQRAEDAYNIPSAVRRTLYGLKHWDMLPPLRSALNEWVAGQSDSLQVWISRQFQIEKWKRASAENGCSQSAIEVTRIIHSAIDALVAMQLPVPPEVLIKLMQGFSVGLQQYCRHIAEVKLIPVTRLMPPLPPVTRYKLTHATKQRAAEAAAKGGVALKKVFLESVPKIELSPDFTLVTNDLSIDKVQVMLLSLTYLRIQVGNFVSTVCTKFLADNDDDTATDNTENAPPSLSHQLQHALDGAARELAQTIEITSKFLAARIVFWDQRQLWLEMLWRHSVRDNGVDPIIAALNATLEDVTTCMREDVRFKFVLALLRTCVMALERVLLHGGPCRWFTVSDMPLLEKDLSKLKDLFSSEGEGLPTDDIDRELSHIFHIFGPMSLATTPLVELLEKANAGAGAANLMVAGETITFDSQTLMSILAHRPDRMGSKFLKTRFKLAPFMIRDSSKDSNAPKDSSAQHVADHDVDSDDE